MSVFRLYGPDELGPDGYPPAWHRQEGNAASAIKVLVRLAAGNRCVRCGHPYRAETSGARGEWSPCDEFCTHGGPCRHQAIIGGVVREAQWRILTVHHLDGDKANCRWWNLAALCQRCHLRIQGKVQMARIWPWEHTDWFRPYVAGYYAHTYLGEDLDRAQVEARVDELLALELA